MVVGVQVRDEDGGDAGQHGVHGVAVVAAELAESSLAAVQQQRLTRAAETQQTGSDAFSAPRPTHLIYNEDDLRNKTRSERIPTLVLGIRIDEI